MADKSIELEDHDWPVVVVRPLRQVSDGELDQFLLDFRHMVSRRRERYGLVLDLRFSKDMSAAQRRRMGDEIKDGEANALCAGTAMVFTSRAMELLLTAIYWIARPEQPMKVFSDFDQAYAWASDQVSGRSALAG